jgi:glyceraldehyde 3-phosphate dehydrogenase
MKTQASLNGFGRFGLHLLNYYLDRYQDCSFAMNSINDETLSVNQMISIIQKDRYVRILENWDMSFDSNSIVFQRESHSIELEICNLPLELYIANKSGILLECSGKYTNVLYLPKTELLQRVYISATSLSADKTLIVGLNETDYSMSDKFISYGSCTVNAYVPAANALHNLFKVLESDVNVIHNVPEYKLNEVPNIF